MLEQLKSRLGRGARIAAGSLSLLGGCQAGPASLSPADVDTLATLAQTPQAAGELVYTGTVRPLGAAESEPLYRYERRTLQHNAMLSSSHITYTMAGELVMRQRATHTADYALRSFDTLDAQTGVATHVRVRDGSVEFSVRAGSHETTRTEPAGAPLVVGPTLFGMVLRHWDELVRGEPLAVRFAVVERARTYAFTLRAVSADAGHTRVQMRADSPLVRTQVDPMTMVFDTASRKIVRYEGRVPAVRRTARGYAPLDARVDYRFAAAGYR